jgi:hypothetical protein
MLLSKYGRRAKWPHIEGHADQVESGGLQVEVERRQRAGSYVMQVKRQILPSFSVWNRCK